MIAGILLGIALATFITSGLLIATTSTGILQENLITGAAIGTEGVISYSIIGLVLSFVAILLLLLMIKPSKN